MQPKSIACHSGHKKAVIGMAFGIKAMQTVSG